MITGIGLDIVEINRIARLNGKSSKFRMRILTPAELRLYEPLSPDRQTEFLAGRFAAKEAFAKAKGTGIGAACRFEDISILPDNFGKPELYFQERRASGLVSITHTKEMAAAQVILTSSS